MFHQEHSEKIKRVYDKRAKFYDKLLKRYKNRLQETIKSLHLEIPDNARVLDLGCGTGLVTGVLISKFPKAEIMGLDYSEGMLNIFRKKFNKVKLILGDFNDEKTFHSFPNKKQIKLKKSSFDLIISTGAIDYADLNRAIPLVHKLIKKEGIFVIAAVRKHPFGIALGKFWNLKPHGKNKIISALRNNGFSEIKHIAMTFDPLLSDHFYYVIKAKKI